MTKDELIVHLSAKMARETVLTDNQVLNVLNSLNAGNKNKLLDLIQAQDARKLGEFILSLMDKKRKNLAENTVTTMLADDTLTTDELILLLA